MSIGFRFQSFMVSKFQRPSGLAPSVLVPIWNTPQHVRVFLADRSFRSEYITLGNTEMSRTYRELLVWNKAKQLALHVYRETAEFPGAERFGLTSQLRRAAVSVSSNIAEGQGRLTKGEFRQFLGQARGSLLELETQMAIAHDLGYLANPSYESLESDTYQVLGLLNRLIDFLSVRAVPAKP